MNLLTERIFDNARCIYSNIQFQIQNRPAAVLPHKIPIPSRCGIPALVLRKGIIHPEIRTHRFSAPGTAGDQFRRHPHIPLFLHHLAYHGLITVGSLMARFRTLPQARATLGALNDVVNRRMISPCQRWRPSAAGVKLAVGIAVGIMLLRKN